MSDTENTSTTADEAREALLKSIADAAATTGAPTHLRNLAEAYALTVGTLTGLQHHHVNVQK